MSVYRSSRFSAWCERQLDAEAEKDHAGRAIEPAKQSEVLRSLGDRSRRQNHGNELRARHKRVKRVERSQQQNESCKAVSGTLAVRVWLTSLKGQRNRASPGRSD